MFRNTQLMTTALDIFISRNENLRWELANFHIHPDGLFIQQRKEDHALAAFSLPMPQCPLPLGRPSVLRLLTLTQD